MQANFVIGIDILKKNLPILPDEKNGRHRQEMVLRAGMLFQVNLELLIFLEILIIDAKSDTESFHTCCVAIRDQGVCEALFFNGRREFLRSIGADGNNLITQPDEL